MVTVAAATFYKEFGRYREIAQREAVSITNHGRESLVLVSAAEYQRLKSIDTRQAFSADQLPDDIVAELEKGYQGELTPHLDHLMK